MQGRQWRKKPSENLIKLMEDSVDIKLFLVQERGPLSLLFQDEQGKKFSITIGNDISCSSDDFCPPGTRCNNGVCEKCDGRYSICKNIFMNYIRLNGSSQ